MAKRLTMEEAERACRQQALPLTVQRRTILEALLPRTDHPTADQIFGLIRERAPEISRTTVYRTLEAFVRVGIARKVCHPGASARYEILQDRHHHLVCLACERMIDIEDSRFDRLPFPDAGAHGFQLSDYSIQFRGLCASCAQSGTAPRRRRPKSDGLEPKS